MEGRAQRQKCCESFSMGVGEEESHSKHKTTVSRRDTQGPMAHAVTDRAPCRWVAGRGRGRRQADKFSEGRNPGHFNIVA